MTDELLKRLDFLVKNNHQDLHGFMGLAYQGMMAQQSVKNIQRHQAATDAQLKLCNPDYEPPEHEPMGDVNIYAGIHASDATLQQMVKSISDNDTTDQTPSTDKSPVPEPIDQPKPNVPEFPDNVIGDKIKSFIGKLLPLLAVAGISIAAANYFAPDDTDTTNEFTIRAEDYIPPE